MGFSQLMITEIMYNSPDPGQDSLEFLEIFNAGDPVNVTGYTLEGVTYEFPNIILPSDGFYYVTSDATAFLNAFGIAADEFSGALSNGGEDVSIMNASGEVEFLVDYDDSFPWPEEGNGTDGQGASIVLCDFDNPNDGLSWRASETPTGLTFDGLEIFASINSIEDVACSGPTGIEVVATPELIFIPADITIVQGETINFTNSGGVHNVNGSLDAYPDNPVGFLSGAPSSEAWIFPVTFDVLGLYNYHSDNFVDQGMTGTVTVIAMPPVDIDLRITEINYNTGVIPDSLEFIEFYNAGEDPVDIAGYRLLGGSIDSEIESGIIQPGEYVYRRGLTVEKAIVLASGLPLSIIIVGIGNENFSMMEQLDSDDHVS